MCWRHDRVSDALEEGHDFLHDSSYREPTAQERARWPMKGMKKRKKRTRKAETAPKYEDVSAAEDLDEKAVTVDFGSPDEVTIGPSSGVLSKQTLSSSRPETFVYNVRLVLQPRDERRDSHLARRLTAPAAAGSTAQLEED